MNDESPRPGSLVAENKGIGSSYVAVGIPQGIVVDGASGEITGAVRRGGEIVWLDKVEYGIWILLLTPMTLATATEVASSSEWGDLDQTIARLRKLDLLVAIEPGKVMDATLERLRPLPLGVGLGNSSADPTRFEIQNAALSLPTPVSIDLVGVMFWSEFDGTRSLREIVGRVTTRHPALSSDRADAVVTQLAYGLMASRLLYLDPSQRTVTCPHCTRKQRIPATATKFICGNPDCGRPTSLS
jgi:hypothetical protein